MHFNNEHAYIYQLPLKCNIQYVILLIMMYLNTLCYNVNYIAKQNEKEYFV